MGKAGRDQKTRKGIRFALAPKRKSGNEVMGIFFFSESLDPMTVSLLGLANSNIYFGGWRNVVHGYWLARVSPHHHTE
ncbi:hypothetical protein Syun_014492 [Stephania yunnanensis]|uniref:Uncharacterized protein n=1 Tax=Stephania yunnanensis TaxID=152371 RepID=A0AAP0JJM5_9MAGN